MIFHTMLKGHYKEAGEDKKEDRQQKDAQKQVLFCCHLTT
jgi:hypothetical protein